MSDLATTVRNQLFGTWPELLKYQDIIHVVYPGIGKSHGRSIEGIVEELLNKAAEGKTKFVFLEAAEALMNFDIPRLDAVLKLLDGRIASSNIFYWTGAVYSEQIYKRLNDKATIISSYYWEKFIDYPADWPHKNYNIHLKDKIFLSFNHLQREHRIRLLNKIIESNLLDKSFYSFVGHGDIKEFVSDLSDNISDYRQLKKIVDQLPLNLNYRITGEDAGKNINSDLDYYENSYFSLVTETVFFKKTGKYHHYYYSDDRFFLTEKIFKPILALHPFIVVSSAGYLHELKRIGYKTFHPYINETYDTVEDDHDRLQMIVEEVQRLSKQTDEEWLAWQTNVKEIVEFNNQHLQTRKDHRITTDVEKYFK